MKNQNEMPKYDVPAPVDLPDRTWPSKVSDRAPVWCSVDLRDGNQALPDPLSPAAKQEYFRLLCDIGFRQIEVAFPSASRDDFDFTRSLIEGDRIPDDVEIMVLTQCRENQIARTFESIQGVRNGILHAYCASSDLHRVQVFNMTRDQVIAMVVDATRQVRTLSDAMTDSKIRYEFSPEEFTDADPAFVMELCVAAYETWGKATPESPMILNLPASVERRPPNQYADLIEAFGRAFPYRENVHISLHTHNDQGMAVASTEMGLLAGADRVEGTLFGHGERTGNVDLVTVAGNLTARNIPCGLDLGDVPKVARTVERLTGMPIYYRAPYSGEYAFTAFSGSHQDAIRKGINNVAQSPEAFNVQWKVPYLHIDPTDLGRRYERLIRINTQSGKGGAAWVLEQEFGMNPPKPMHPQIGTAVQAFSDEVGREITAHEVFEVFERAFVRPDGPIALEGYWPRPDDEDPTQIHGELRIVHAGRPRTVTARGNGPISAFVEGLRQLDINGFRVDDYAEEAIGESADARAVAYVPLRWKDGTVLYGVGIDTNIDQAAIKAIVAGLNRKALLAGAPDAE